MKTTLLILTLCMSMISIAQEGKVYEPIEVTVKASYKNGTGDIMTYVSTNFKQPFICILDKVKTSFRMRFVINEDGSISNITVTGCDAEGTCCAEITTACEDMLKEMKDWKPAELKGVKVKQWAEIPLSINNGG